MFNEEFVNQAWALYQASLKHSTEDADVKKWHEEHKELALCLFDGIRDLDDEVYHEVADNIIMVIRMLFRTYQPKSIEHAKEILSYMGEFMTSKFDRQMVERGWNK